MTDHNSKQNSFLRSLFKKQSSNNGVHSVTASDQIDTSFTKKFLSFIKNHPDIILLFSLDGKVLSSNTRDLSDYLGFGAKKKIRLEDLFSKENLSLLKTHFQESTKGKTVQIETDTLNNQGELLYFSVTLFPIETPDKGIEGVLTIIRDITMRKMLEQENDRKALKIIETNENYHYIFNHLKYGIWMAESMSGKITFASEGMKDIMQIPLSTIYDNQDYWEDMIDPMHREEFIEKHILLNSGKGIEQEYKLTDGTGEIKWIYEQTIPKVDESGEITHLFGMISDISKRMEMQETLEFLAKNDALTGLPNYHSLHEELDLLIKDKATDSFALLYIDLDDFDWIIDYLGHDIGEMVLKKIANRLISMGHENSYLAKIESDAFVFVVRHDEDKETVFQFAEDIIKKVKEKINVKGYEFHVTASIGISFYPDNGQENLILLERARTALSKAKQLGKNNYQIYSSHRDFSSHKKYLLEKDLRQAIQNEAFEIYYQPQVNPKSGLIEAAEALIRWNHQEWGVISPAEFISLAEERHIIHEMEDWVIKTVCQQLHIWKEKEYPLYPIAINMSPMRFLKPGIIDTLKKELSFYDVSPSYIEIEIKESSFSNIEENVTETIMALKELGVRIALDDFGTGYSSFRYLQDFNFDKLKIDLTFVKNLGSENKKDAAIYSSFLHLAKGLKMKVVAQGVEDAEQLEFLKQNECDLLQGYLYSQPLPVKHFEELMKRRYLKPKEKKEGKKPEIERRSYFRFAFPTHLPVVMNLVEVNKRSVKMGSAHILVENISIGGIKFLSTLRLPVSSNIKFNFQIKLMNETFDLNGSLVYKNEEKLDTFSYGVSFITTEGEQDRLAEIINKMAVFKKINSVIPETDFIDEDPYLYLQKHLL